MASEFPPAVRASLPPPSAPPPSQPPERDDAATELATRAILHVEEVVRARVFFRVALIILGLLGAALPFLPGAAWLRGITGGFAAITAAFCIGALVVLREPSRYTPRVATSVGIACSAATVAIIYYLGLFSGAVGILVVGIYFFGLSESRRAARAIYAVCALLYLAGSAAIAADVLPDRSLFSTEHVPHTSRWYRVAMSQAIFGMTFYLARSSRRSTERAIARAREAFRAVEQRDALLAEARSELDRALRPGDGRLTGQTVGSYLLAEVLGRGGMGEVYRAVHAKTGKRAAVKLLHPVMLDNDEAVRRFLREAQAAAAVPTEHVAEVYEVGATQNGMPYIAMALLEGHDLAWHLRRTPRLPLKTVVTMVDHAARALAAVRDAGVVHRDLKPGNLFLTDTLPRTWKVLDFGLSKIQGGETLTKDVAVGTPQYMAPEQVRGGAVDARADLYALAAIAYRAITGEPPFSGDDIGALLLDVLYRTPNNPSEVVKLPVDVELALAIALAKRPDDRFGSVEDFAHALRAASSGNLRDAARAHGWALLKKHPWGSSTRTGERRARSRAAASGEFGWDADTGAA